MLKEEPRTLVRREGLPQELATWDPWGIMGRMRDSMEGMFTDLFRSLPSQEIQLGFNVIPSVDIYQQGDNLIAECAVPGLTKKDVEVEVTPEFLLIRGESKRSEQLKKEGFYRSEISYGKIFRKIHLPVGVRTDQVKANLENGILRVTMALQEPALHKATSVKVD